MKCTQCGADLDFTMSTCPSCGTEVELGRLTGILGIVCRGCDAYNDPGAKVCVSCGAPLGGAPTPAPVEGGADDDGLEADVEVDTDVDLDGGEPGDPLARAASAAPPEPGAPVVRSFPRSGAATRFVPAAAARPPAPAPGSPIPLVSRCPRCGALVGSGTFCAQCGQGLGHRGTQVMARTPGPTASPPSVTPAAEVEPGRAELVLERGEGPDGARYVLSGDRTEVGRAKGAVIFADDPCLAPHHATFFYRAGALNVRDEGGAGGTYLKLRGLSVPLRPGDHFVVGDRLLRLAGPLPPPPSSPPDGTRRLGSPRPTGAAVVLEEWLEGGATGRVFVRGGPSVTIGRAGCAVNLGDDPHLSQAHAEVLVEPDGSTRLRDLGSSNGTFLRIPPHGERELRDGDTIRIGREVLRVAMSE